MNVFGRRGASDLRGGTHGLLLVGVTEYARSTTQSTKPCAEFTADDGEVGPTAAAAVADDATNEEVDGSNNNTPRRSSQEGTDDDDGGGNTLWEQMTAREGRDAARRAGMGVGDWQAERQLQEALRESVQVSSILAPAEGYSSSRLAYNREPVRLLLLARVFQPRGDQFAFRERPSSPFSRFLAVFLHLVRLLF